MTTGLPSLKSCIRANPISRLFFFPYIGPDYIERAIQVGAKAYVSKSVGADGLLSCCRSRHFIVAGEKWASVACSIAALLCRVVDAVFQIRNVDICLRVQSIGALCGGFAPDSHLSPKEPPGQFSLVAFLCQKSFAVFMFFKRTRPGGRRSLYEMARAVWFNDANSGRVIAFGSASARYCR